MATPADGIHSLIYETGNTPDTARQRGVRGVSFLFVAGGTHDPIPQRGFPCHVPPHTVVSLTVAKVAQTRCGRVVRYSQRTYSQPRGRTRRVADAPAG